MAEASAHGRGEVLLFSRLPGCGGKRRLAADIGERHASMLAEAFFKDSLAVALATGMPVTVVYTAEGDAALPSLPPGVRAVPQCSGDMGDRLTRALGAVAGVGRWPVLIGSDTPDLPLRLIREAFDALEDEADVVLGPAEDGGFYLIGVRAADAFLFEGVAWSTETVFASVEANARRLGLRLGVLDSWQDVDDAEGLAALERRLLACPGTAPATRHTLGASHAVEPDALALSHAQGPAHLGRTR